MVMLRSLKLRACVTTIIAVNVATYKADCLDKPSKSFDVVVIGAGVVGLSVARECATKFHKSVLLVDKEDCIAAGVSSGNSGLGCTGYDAPVGSLERQLLRRSIQLHQNLYRSCGLSHEHVRKCGSLVVAWTTEELEKLKEVLLENQEAGDSSVELLSQQELRDLEPALSHAALGAVLLPNEAIVEPWLVPIAHAESAIVHGVQFQLNSKVTKASFDSKDQLWNITTVPSSDQSLGRSTCNNKLSSHVMTTVAAEKSESIIKAKVVINCAGLYGDVIESLRTSERNNTENEKESFKIAPRKGQFVVFKPIPDAQGPLHIIEPVATQFTKGVIIWRTVYGNVIVGPTAVEVESKDDRSTDSQTVESLQSYGAKVFPVLTSKDLIVGTYSGIRPATQYRDYQITSYPAQQWICVGGIRSTGLTASTGIGEYVSELLEDSKDGKGLKVLPRPSQKYLDLIQRGQVKKGSSDGLVGVSEVAATPLSARNHPSMKPFPTLRELSREYRQSLQDAGLSASSGVGSVTINGHKYRVTHPISSFGMESYGRDDN